MIGMEKRKENFQLVKTFSLVSIFQVLENLRLYHFSVIKIPLNNSSEIE